MSGSFLENQYDKSDNPFELGPLAKKIKASKVEVTKKEAKKIVNSIVQSSSPYGALNPMEQSSMNAMNSYMNAYMTYMNAYMNSPFIYPINPIPRKELEATNHEIAESLSQLEYEDISDIVDRAYELKSMRKNELTESSGPR